MKTINPTRVIDNSKLNGFHVSLIFWCFLIILFDGYDVVIFGVVVPSLMEEWSISSVTTGAIGSYTAIGTALGAVIFGLLADKIGRKTVICYCTALFSLFTALAGFAEGPVSFTIMRVIAGLGLGGVMPNIIALSTEYAPKQLRNVMISFVFCGYSFGAVAASLISKSILPTMGWKPIFWIAGIPLLLLPFIMKSIPESTGFLLEKKKDTKIRRILKKVNPQFHMGSDASFEQPKAKEKGSPLVNLFEKKRTLSTLMFWISCFSCFVLIYALNTWLPKLMIQAGYSLSSSLLFVAMMNIGAIVGTILCGRLMDRWGFKKVMIPLYLFGAVSLATIGLTKNIWIAYVLIAIIGAASVGVQNISNAFVSQYYPPAMRSTGIGATMAFGRVGGIVAPIFVGILLTMNLSAQMNFTALAMAGVLGAVSILFVQERYAYYRTGDDDEQIESSSQIEEMKSI